MAGATNTIIQILRSDVTSLPTTLNPGEQAYSYVSDKLFIGNTNNSVLTIGGKYYVDLIDGATAANTGNTIVRRDNAGNAAFKMISVSDAPSQSTDVVNKSYLDGLVGSLSSNTIYEGTVGSDGYSNVHTSNTDAGGSVIIVANNTTVATFTKTEASFVQDVLVTGNLTVRGATSYTNVETLLVDNNEIVMNANASGQPLIDAFITVNRGAADNAAIIWNESTDKWQLDSATGSIYDIVDTGGGQSIGGTTTLNAASVTNDLHVGVLEVSGHANVSSITANGTIIADQLIVAANVELANVANVSVYASISHADSHIQNQHFIVLSHSISGNNAIEANNYLQFDTANTTLAVGYSAYTPLPNTIYQGTGSSLSYVQNNLQNLNNEGSADYVVTADNGSDSIGFLDMGMAGGAYDFLQSSGETGPFKPNDGFIQVVGSTGIGKGNLIIATGTANTDFTEVGSIIMSIGNQTYSNIVGYITRENNSTTGTPTFAFGKGASANSAYTFDLNGAANVGSVYINNTKVLGEGFALPVAFGGSGLQTVTANSVLFGNGTGAFGVTNAPSAGQVLQYRTDGVKFGGLDGGTF
jgi:hypothetical protein